MGKNSLIDSDFIEEGDLDDPMFDPHEKEREEFEDRELLSNFPAPDTGQNDRGDASTKKKSADQDDGLEVEIVDDTPPEDRNKWVADDDDELPSEDDNDVKKYSKEVQERISKLTARAHAERRAKEERDRQMNEALSVADRLLKENNELKGLLENGHKALLGEHKGRLEGQLSSAKAAYREALEASDTNGIIAAQEQIARIAAQMERLSTQRPTQLPRGDDKLFEKFREPAPQQTGGPSQTALQWRQRNPWFETDIPMQSFALGVHRQLVEQGTRVDTPEYYKAIDNEVRKRFPDRFQNERSEQTAPRRRGSVVAPATRASGKSPRKITLTESQVRIAKRLNLTPEQYAKQVLAEQENGYGKEFTHSTRR